MFEVVKSQVQPLSQRSFSVSYVNSLQILAEHVRKHHAVVLKFFFGGHVTLELLHGKTSFQAHNIIVELYKSYRMVVE